MFVSVFHLMFIFSLLVLNYESTFVTIKVVCNQYYV